MLKKIYRRKIYEYFFGTDGWRGLLDKEVNEQSISIVAQAFADYLNEIKNDNSVAIGFDGRKNSQLFAKIFAEVLSGNKVKVFFIRQSNSNSGSFFYCKE